MDYVEQEHIILGDTVELVIGSIVTRTNVQEIVDGEHFVVSQPTHQLIPVFFREREEALFYFFRPDGLYSFRAEYGGREIREGNIAVCHFHIVSPVEKNQKRYAYRLPVTLTGTIREKDPAGRNGLKEEEHSILTVNLSVDGLLFSGNFQMEMGTHVLITLNLTERETMILEGQLLRFERRTDPEENHCFAAQFENMGKRDQMRLSRFILNQQVIERRIRPDGD